jgi:hypothetical protein
VEVPMDALQWDFAPEEVSLQQSRESYDRHEFDLKDLDKPKMTLEEGGDVYR